MKFPFPGKPLMRRADGQYTAEMPQQPPRPTRYEPVAGPVGSSAGDFA